MKIDSIKDPRIELARSLNAKIGRKTHDKILLFGNEQIPWAIAANLHIDFVLSKNPIMLPNSIPVFSVSEGILKK